MDGRRVLIVEDDAEVLELLRDILRFYGFVPVGVRHPDLVLDVAACEHPDLFLIDVMLPKRGGVELAETLRSNGFADVPMIALSASPIMRDLAVHTGVFDAALTNPFDLDRLMRCIVEQLDRRTTVASSLPETQGTRG